MEDRALVLEQPNWTRRTRALFRRLDDSPALQAEFLNDPGAALAQTFEVVPPAGVRPAVSAENRILHAILSDPAPLGAESPEDGYAPLYRAISNLEANLNAQQQFQLDSQAQTTLNTGAHFATAQHAQLHAQLTAHTHTSVKLSMQLEAGAGADSGGTARAAVERRSRLDLQKLAGFIASQTASGEDAAKPPT